MPEYMEGATVSVRFRALRADDHLACLALWRLCDAAAARMWEDAAALARLIDRNPSMSWVAEYAGRTIGTVLCGHDGWRGWLYHVAVDPAWRRRGIATAMVSRAQVELAKANVRRVDVIMQSGNRDAMQFWTAGGWCLREDLSVMSCDLGVTTLN